jgi:2'-5' RNA ligase
MGPPLAGRADLEGSQGQVTEPEPFESALLVPVPEAEPYVQRHRFRYDSVALRGVPAHITVLFPFVPPGAMTEATPDAVRDVIAEFSAFPFSLTRLERFPEGACYLAPDPAEPFRRLTMAIAERFPEYPPYAGVHAEVIPHLTVAQTQDAPFDDLAEIERHLPIQCVAREAWLMMEDDEHRWNTRSRFALAASDRA